MAKSQCNVCGLWFDDMDLDSHLNQHLDESAEQPTDPTVKKCPSCNIDMDTYYGVPFRVGGTGPLGRAFLGEWAELGEEPIPIDLYVCAQCGRILPFANEKTRNKLRRAARHKP